MNYTYLEIFLDENCGLSGCLLTLTSSSRSSIAYWDLSNVSQIFLKKNNYYFLIIQMQTGKQFGDYWALDCDNQTLVKIIHRFLLGIRLCCLASRPMFEWKNRTDYDSLVQHSQYFKVQVLHFMLLF